MKKERLERLMALTNLVASENDRDDAPAVDDGKMRTGMGMTTQHARLEARIDALQLSLKRVQDETAAIFIALDAIEPNPWHPRKLFRTESLLELCKSIRAIGVLQPISVRKHPTDEGRYQLISGERRIRACRMLELRVIPGVWGAMEQGTRLSSSDIPSFF